MKNEYKPFNNDKKLVENLKRNQALCLMVANNAGYRNFSLRETETNMNIRIGQGKKGTELDNWYMHKHLASFKKKKIVTQLDSTRVLKN